MILWVPVILAVGAMLAALWCLIETNKAAARAQDAADRAEADAHNARRSSKRTEAAVMYCARNHETELGS